MATEITFDQLRAKALQARLKLADEELQKLLPGVNRALRQAEELRRLIADGTEPASRFRSVRVDKVSPP